MKAVSHPHVVQHCLRCRLAAPLVLVLLLLAGCGQKAPWPVRPDYAAPAGVLGPTPVTGYDVSGDGRIDYLQAFDDRGRKRHLFFDVDGRVGFDSFFDQNELTDTSRYRTLMVLVDGVSYELVEQLWLEGRLRIFYPPGRLIGGFPTVTDTIYADFFETPRPFGYEAIYLDLERMEEAGGRLFYLKGGNEPVWPQRMLYRQSHFFDGLVYVWRDWVTQRELEKSMAAAGRWLADASGPPYAAIYMVNTDAIGHSAGHEALKDYLRQLDLYLERLLWQSRGRLRIVMMADHGINQRRMRRVDLRPALAAAGFNLTEKPRGPRDVYMPKFGLVSHVVIYTERPAEVAEAMVAQEGVELAVYQTDQQAVMVRDSRGGVARIERRGTADAARREPSGEYRYVPQVGDPLQLAGTVEQMRRYGAMDGEGWASARAWLAATCNHCWPDPVVRLSHAFQGNVRNPSQVLLSLAPQYYSGETSFDFFASLEGTHGSLHREATVTFVLSNFFDPPACQRTIQLREYLKERLGRTTLLPGGAEALSGGAEESRE